ncbi:MAG TPA: acyl-CoA desaturase [Steroidobacteraceae bacterium]|nr:acyl-CoA desaturase [Steroidobacteraceae bacterium]
MNARLVSSLRRWFDAGTHAEADGGSGVDWPRVLPFLLVHAGCLGVAWTGASGIAIATAIALFWLRMFAITAFYHRYFSHRAFRTSRAAQFVFALLGATAVQRGPLWWAAHHRQHHAQADGLADPHSPKVHGFLWSHVKWFLARENFATREKLVRDLARFPELRWLDRWDAAVPAALALALLGVGAWLERAAPALGTGPWQMLVWGFCISTVALWHATFTINSLAHRFGSRRYATRDESRNNGWLALLTLGEGWHNNHHRYPAAARQGFYWWEIDISYLALKVLSALGIVWGLRPVPAAIRDSHRAPGQGAPR